jgi:hypothetical protein
MKEGKMSKQIVCIVIVLSFVIVGCNWQSAQINRYSQITKTWNGKNIDDLMYKWGYPQQLLTAENGNKVYVYSREFIYTTPKWTTPITNFTIYGGESSFQYCYTYFETDNNKTIVKSSYEGNSCN